MGPRRTLLLTLAAALGGLAAGFLSGTLSPVLPLAPQPAAAVAPADVVGTYRLRIRGDGWREGGNPPFAYRWRRIRGVAELVVSRAEPATNSRLMDVRIRLAGPLAGSILDTATPTPDLSGQALLVGDTLSIIGTGDPQFVNAATLRFSRNGRRVAGHWLAAFPPTGEAGGFGSGVGVTINGRLVPPGRIAVPTAGSR